MSPVALLLLLIAQGEAPPVEAVTAPDAPPPDLAAPGAAVESPLAPPTPLADAPASPPTTRAPAGPGEASPAPVSPAPLSLSLNGYWKVRSVYVQDLFLGQADFTDIGRTAEEPSAGRLRALSQTGFLAHALRLQPAARWGEHLTLTADVDLLDGVVWGDNDAEAATGIFAGSPTDTGRFGTLVDSLHVRRVWLELETKVGRVRVGRQPSQWGMGLLANKGDGLDADFGDYAYGSTVDRVLFATKPVSIVRTVLGHADTSSNLTLALAYDKLVDDDLTVADVDSERACLTCAPQILLARPGDDVDEWVGVLLYKNDAADLLTSRDQLHAGVYVVYRDQRTTASSAWVVDGYLKLRLGYAGLESELLWITGETSALDGESPKEVDIKGGVVRGGFYAETLDLELEGGYAPGDGDPLNEEFTGYPLHPDFNVGLILYDEVLAARTARAWTQDGRGLWSRGGVYNSFYLQPKARWRPMRGLTAILAFLWARGNEDDGPLWAATRAPEGRELDLGWEVDAAVRYDFFEHAHLKLEGGVLVPGKALWKDTNADLRVTGADRAEVAWSLQGRLGLVW